MKDSYRWLALVYTPLSKLVFGSTRDQANSYFLKVSRGKTLVIGGGDGNSYVSFSKELKGDYWEKSASMLQLAQKNLKDSGFSFYLGDFQSNQTFDQICLPFVLDLMPDEEIGSLLDLLKMSMNSDSRIIFSDFFEPTSTYQKIFLELLIVAHRFFSNHQRSDIPNYPAFFEEKGFHLIQEKVWKNGWIRAQVYQLRN